MFGAFLFMFPLTALLLALAIVVLIAITRIVSLSTLLGVTIAAAIVICREPSNLPLVINYAAFWVLAMVRHKGNIERLLKGEERKLEFGSKKKKANEQ